VTRNRDDVTRLLCGFTQCLAEQENLLREVSFFYFTSGQADRRSSSFVTTRPLFSMRTVAAAPDITDLASFQKSFAAHGWKHRNGFETELARRITTRVTAEVSRAGDNASRQRRPRG
jgi:hypothetical protein